MPSNGALLHLLLTLISSLVPTAKSSTFTIFNFNSFSPNTPGIIYSGDAFTSGGDNVIQLTRNQLKGNINYSAGQAVYNTPIHLRDPNTGAGADFTTTFGFNIEVLDTGSMGDGLGFFLAPPDYKLPLNSNGSYLGLFNSTTNAAASTRLVAVEFDTYRNSWDPEGNHIGIDIDSIVSNKTAPWITDLQKQSMGLASIRYNSTSNNLDVYLLYGSFPRYRHPYLSYKVNLLDVLPEKVIVGFSASTGRSTELHQIRSWEFTSSINPDQGDNKAGRTRKHVPWVVGFVVGIGGVTAAVGYFLFFRRRLVKKRRSKEEFALDASIENKFVTSGTGPRRFSYKELVAATKDFSDEGKLGQGGFGGVYLGVMAGKPAEKVAVKRISRGSSQGRKEYVSEVTVISRLRHRNLVKLIGWCHDYGEFLLVYEYMPNGSLDSYLFGKRSSLAWPVRYGIAQGLAMAVLYLHEEWEQCVVHRDIKASNVMLDSGFSAKLGDFGLARLVDHSLGWQTTVLAGTMGYLAPECVTTGRASKESDVYSFGVVVLEIACGRKAIEPKAAESEVRLVDWVWGLYGQGRVVDAADPRLGKVFDGGQMERLMVLGLWCAHPDHTVRPSIRAAIQVLKLEAPVPHLPNAVPKPTYYALPLDMNNFLYTTTTTTTGLQLSGVIGNTTSTRPSQTSSRASSADSLLQTRRE